MAELELVCVPTRILTDNDDIVDAIVEFGGHNIGPEDIVCVAESVVAITQGRFTRPEELNVCWQARLINRFIHPDGSMASIYGMQSAMNLDGKWKVLGAFILGAIAKIFRKPGVFYAIARAASLTDDVTGTMPPFDKHIVFGPNNRRLYSSHRDGYSFFIYNETEYGLYAGLKKACILVQIEIIC